MERINETIQKVCSGERPQKLIFSNAGCYPGYQDFLFVEPFFLHVNPDFSFLFLLFWGLEFSKNVLLLPLTMLINRISLASISRQRESSANACVSVPPVHKLHDLTISKPFYGLESCSDRDQKQCHLTNQAKLQAAGILSNSPNAQFMSEPLAAICLCQSFIK